jgi:hypothetical protein
LNTFFITFPGERGGSLVSSSVVRLRVFQGYAKLPLFVIDDDRKGVSVGAGNAKAKA